VKIQNNVSVYEGVALEDDVLLRTEHGVHQRHQSAEPHLAQGRVPPTMVRRGATIGANATVICGHTIGSFAFVGAGAVVTRDVPDHALVVGVPARVVGWMCRCGLRLTFGAMRAECGGCGGRYARRGRHVVPLA
jgi:UDP-2-acetamido-3-amino-2,3-dideoxy-glucuronate N-acetyltransferase